MKTEMITAERMHFLNNSVFFFAGTGSFDIPLLLIRPQRVILPYSVHLLGEFSISWIDHEHEGQCSQYGSTLDMHSYLRIPFNLAFCKEPSYISFHNLLVQQNRHSITECTCFVRGRHG